MTKTITVALVAATISIAAVTAQAGGLAAPVMEPQIIVEETQSGSHAWVLYALTLAALVTALAD